MTALYEDLNNHLSYIWVSSRVSGSAKVFSNHPNMKKIKAITSKRTSKNKIENINRQSLLSGSLETAELVKAFVLSEPNKSYDITETL